MFPPAAARPGAEAVRGRSRRALLRAPGRPALRTFPSPTRHSEVVGGVAAPPCRLRTTRKGLSEEVVEGDHTYQARFIILVMSWRELPAIMVLRLAEALLNARTTSSSLAPRKPIFSRWSSS